MTTAKVVNPAVCIVCPDPATTAVTHPPTAAADGAEVQIQAPVEVVNPAICIVCPGPATTAPTHPSTAAAAADGVEVQI